MKRLFKSALFHEFLYLKVMKLFLFIFIDRRLGSKDILCVMSSHVTWHVVNGIYILRDNKKNVYIIRGQLILKINC